MDESTHEEGTFDPTRKLCPDGACVGVIGPDGTCSECGRTEAAAESGAEAPAAFAAAEGGQVSEAESGFDTSRRLCDDGACVGVVGDDGVCRVCGRRAE